MRTVYDSLISCKFKNILLLCCRKLFKV